jgi:branched-chain amino acid transport system substrate-binding protein
MRRDRARFSLLAAGSAVTALTLAACGGGNASTTSTTSTNSSSGNGAKPIVVGISLPLTGQFSADGIATEHGYELWQSDVNANGGLLGRPLQLKIVNDNSNPDTVTKDYTTLITVDHVDLTLAPFSTLLTASAQPVAEKYHYALAAGSATGPAVFAKPDPYFFSVSVPDATEMQPFANWVATLPAGQKPTTAAYPMVSDPFADPPVEATENYLSKHGVHTVYATDPQHAVTPNATDSNLTGIADRVAAAHPQMVVLGTVDVPSLLAFVNAFKAKGFTPKIMIASSGPDQGEEFLHHIGVGNSQAIMVPDGWYGGEQNALSHVMVQDYIAKFGGTTNDINADVAEAYSAGETLAAAVRATGTLNNTTIERYLHTHTVQTVQGAATFNDLGENSDAQHQAFIFQWQNSQFLQVLPTHPGPAALTLKPNWG